MLRNFLSPRRVWVYVDGAIRPDQGATGLAAIVRDEVGRICHWWSRRVGLMTNNEAEYAAVILALERLRKLRPRHVVIYTDSRVVVDQMCGVASVRALNLRDGYHRLRALTAEFELVTFHHLPREHNRLADALANETVDGVWRKER